MSAPKPAPVLALAPTVNLHPEPTPHPAHVPPHPCPKPPPDSAPVGHCADTHLHGPRGAVDVAEEAVLTLRLHHPPPHPACGRPQLGRQPRPHQPLPLHAGEGQCCHRLRVCGDAVSHRCHVRTLGCHRTAWPHGPLPVALPPSCLNLPWCSAASSRRITSSRTRLRWTHSASTPRLYW